MSSRAEVPFAIIGASLVAGVVAFLAYQAVAVPDTGPDLHVAVSRIERVDDRFVVHVRVGNDGDQTARGVAVAGSISSDGKTIQQANTTVSYVPPTSSRRAALVFTRDPREASLSVRVSGYELP